MTRSGDVVEVFESNYPKICQRPWLHRPFCEKQQRPSKATPPPSKCHFFTGCRTFQQKWQNCCVSVCRSRYNFFFHFQIERAVELRNISRKDKTVQSWRKNKCKLRGQSEAKTRMEVLSVEPIRGVDSWPQFSRCIPPLPLIAAPDLKVPRRMWFLCISIQQHNKIWSK